MSNSLPCSYYVYGRRPHELVCVTLATRGYTTEHRIESSGGLEGRDITSVPRPGTIGGVDLREGYEAYLQVRVLEYDMQCGGH